MNSQSFKPRYYNNVFVGVIMIALAALTPLAKGSFLDKLSISLCFGVIGVLMIIHTLSQRLTFTDEGVKITGLIPRKMKYQDIASIGRGKVMYKSGAGAGYAGTIDIISKNGKRLRLLPMKFANYRGEQGWASKLNSVIKKYPIDANTELEQSLTKAANSGSNKP